ncbi:MAG: DUF4129 domain-containing protein [Bacteroidales bacterium]|nr:DUF4129 domain-containing protein [Bacteroidales bacterium]
MKENFEIASLACLLLLAFCFTASARDDLMREPAQAIIPVKPKPSVHYGAPSDSSHLDVRVPAETALGKFRNDPDFNYTRDVAYGKTLWETVKYYIAKFFRRLHDIDGSDKWLRWLWIALLAGVVMFGLFKMLGVEVSRIFFSKPPVAVDLSDTVIDETSDRKKMGIMLEKALDEKQYRLAVRLTYLIVLKRLADAGQIHWQADKTNRSYFDELSDETLRQPFANLTRLYEYVWYGDFDIHAEHYRDIEADFNELNRRLR